eukprot:Gb_24114 [translate_table: standard]
MYITMAQTRGLPPWSYEQQHDYSACNPHGKFRDLFHYDDDNVSSFVGFKHQSIQGTCIAASTSTSSSSFVSPSLNRWKKPTQNYDGFSLSQNLRTLCREGRLQEALNILHLMDQQGISADAYTYICLLQACANMRALAEGKQVHAHILKNGFVPNSYLENKVVVMYAKCGSLLDARQVFEKISHRNALSWASMIGMYARQKHWKEALLLFYQMQSEGMHPDNFIIPSVLKACACLTALEQGKEIHGYIVRRRFELDVFVVNALVDMYAKCGSIDYAKEVFDKMSAKDVVSWTAIIAGYAHNGQADEALKLYREMELSGVEADAIAWNAMIAAFAQNGQGDEAVKLLGQMQLSGVEPGVNSWNAIISGCAQNGYAEEAFKLFFQMQLAEIKPNSVTIPVILPACSELGALKQGSAVHSYTIKSGFESNVFVGSALVDMYAKCGSIYDARHVFDGMSERNVVIWNSMIAGYSQNGNINEALEIFHQMQLSNVKTDVITWNAMITGYARNGHRDEGLKLFFQMQLAGLKPNLSSWNALIAGSVQSGQGKEALELFRQMQGRCVMHDMDSGGALISGYEQNGNGDEVFKLSPQIGTAEMKPNSVTIASVLPACASLANLCHGKEIHGYILRNGFESNVFVGSALIDMYAKCQSIEDARIVFDIFSQRNVVSWNVMIAGYAQNDNGDKALKLFRQMQLEGMKPNSATIMSILSACAILIALQEVKEIHCYITRSGIESDVFVRTALVDVYAKCGSITYARQVFDKISQRDVIIWNAMIAGYAMHGLGENALTLFYQMQHAGIKPDHITFTAVLSACSNAGMMDEGWKLFNLMSEYYGITPCMEHYTCMVNLLGRAGLLNEAQDLINKMPLKPDACLWGTLLGACRIHCNIELAERAAKFLFELEPANAGNYMILSNIYAAVGRWDDVVKVRRMMKDKGLKTSPGCSWIKVKNRMQIFLAGDNSQPAMERIHATLRILAVQMEEAGYIPDINFAQQVVEEEEQEHILCGHSEKLAIAFGLINTCPWTPIRVIKNLRMCGDCHTATKFISKIAKREVFVRDANHFHYFKDGVCSCGDYW